MLCTKCGKPIEEGQKKCLCCGAKTKVAEPKNGKKRIIFFGVTSVFAVIIILAAVVFMCVDFFSSAGSYTVVIDKALNAVQNIDVEEYMEILPQDYIQYTLNTNKNYEKYDDMLLDYEDKLWQENRSNKKAYGTDFKIVYEVDSEVHYQSEKDLSKLTKEFNNKYNGQSEITEAVKAVVSTEVKSSKASGNRKTSEMYFIKIDGIWYLDIDKVTGSLSQ